MEEQNIVQDDFNSAEKNYLEDNITEEECSSEIRGTETDSVSEVTEIVKNDDQNLNCKISDPSELTETECIETRDIKDTGTEHQGKFEGQSDTSALMKLAEIACNSTDSGTLSEELVESYANIHNKEGGNETELDKPLTHQAECFSSSFPNNTNESSEGSGELFSRSEIQSVKITNETELNINQNSSPKLHDSAESNFELLEDTESSKSTVSDFHKSLSPHFFEAPEDEAKSESTKELLEVTESSSKSTVSDFHKSLSPHSFEAPEGKAKSESNLELLDANESSSKSTGSDFIKPLSPHFFETPEDKTKSDDSNFDRPSESVDNHDKIHYKESSSVSSCDKNEKIANSNGSTDFDESSLLASGNEGTKDHLTELATGTTVNINTTEEDKCPQTKADSFDTYESHSSAETIVKNSEMNTVKLKEKEGTFLQSEDSSDLQNSKKNNISCDSYSCGSSDRTHVEVKSTSQHDESLNALENANKDKIDDSRTTVAEESLKTLDKKDDNLETVDKDVQNTPLEGTLDVDVMMEETENTDTQTGNQLELETIPCVIESNASDGVKALEEKIKDKGDQYEDKVGTSETSSVLNEAKNSEIERLDQNSREIVREPHDVTSSLASDMVTDENKCTFNAVESNKEVTQSSTEVMEKEGRTASNEVFDFSQDQREKERNDSPILSLSKENEAHVTKGSEVLNELCHKNGSKVNENINSSSPEDVNENICQADMAEEVSTQLKPSSVESENSDFSSIKMKDSSLPQETDTKNVTNESIREVDDKGESFNRTEDLATVNEESNLKDDHIINETEKHTDDAVTEIHTELNVNLSNFTDKISTQIPPANEIDETSIKNDRQDLGMNSGDSKSPEDKTESRTEGKIDKMEETSIKNDKQDKGIISGDTKSPEDKTEGKIDKMEETSIKNDKQDKGIKSGDAKSPEDKTDSSTEDKIDKKINKMEETSIKNDRQDLSIISGDAKSPEDKTESRTEEMLNVCSDKEDLNVVQDLRNQTQGLKSSSPSKVTISEETRELNSSGTDNDRHEERRVQQDEPNKDFETEKSVTEAESSREKMTSKYSSDEDLNKRSEIVEDSSLKDSFSEVTQQNSECINKKNSESETVDIDATKLHSDSRSEVSSCKVTEENKEHTIRDEVTKLHNERSEVSSSKVTEENEEHTIRDETTKLHSERSEVTTCKATEENEEHTIRDEATKLHNERSKATEENEEHPIRDEVTKLHSERSEVSSCKPSEKNEKNIISDDTPKVQNQTASSNLGGKIFVRKDLTEDFSISSSRLADTEKTYGIENEQEQEGRNSLITPSSQSDKIVKPDHLISAVSRKRPRIETESFDSPSKKILKSKPVSCDISDDSDADDKLVIVENDEHSFPKEKPRKSAVKRTNSDDFTSKNARLKAQNNNPPGSAIAPSIATSPRDMVKNVTVSLAPVCGSEGQQNSNLSENETTLDALISTKQFVCEKCKSVWSDYTLKMLFEGNESVTINSRITYGAIICMNIYVATNFPDYKEKALRALLDRADLAKNLGSIKVSILNSWLVALIKNKKISCCNPFRPVYRMKTNQSKISSANFVSTTNQSDKKKKKEPQKSTNTSNREANSKPASVQEIVLDDDEEIRRDDCVVISEEAYPAVSVRNKDVSQSATSSSSSTLSSSAEVVDKDANQDVSHTPVEMKAAFTNGNKMAITNGNIYHQLTTKFSPILHKLVLEERQSIDPKLHQYYDKLVCETKITEDEARCGKRKHLSVKEILNIHSVCILNAAEVRVDDYFQLFLQILYHRGFAAFIPDGKSLVKHVENIRREDNRLKWNVNKTKNYRSSSWDADSFYSGFHSLICTTKSSGYPSIRDILVEFCSWKNEIFIKNVDTQRKLNFSHLFPDDIEVGDFLGLCVKLYSTYCRLVFDCEEIDSKKLKIFLDLLYLPQKELDQVKDKTVINPAMSLRVSGLRHLSDIILYLEDQTKHDNEGAKWSLSETVVDWKLEAMKKLKEDLVGRMKNSKIEYLLGKYGHLKNEENLLNISRDVFSEGPEDISSIFASYTPEVKLIVAKLRAGNVPVERIPSIIDKIFRSIIKRRMPLAKTDKDRAFS